MFGTIFSGNYKKKYLYFDLFPKLRARPKYQLLSAAAIPCAAEIICLNQPLWGMHSRGEPL